MLFIRKIVFVLITILLVNCNNIANEKQIVENKTSNEVKYSSLFEIVKKENYKIITVFDPWNKSEVLKKYYLVPKTVSNLNNIPKDGIIVRTPVESVIALSSTQIGIIDALNKVDKIKAVSEKKLIYSKKLRNLIDEGKIKIVHESMNIDFEKVISIKPELIFATGWNIVDSKFQRFESAGIPTAFIYEWQEETPLARTEWIKFIAAFFEDDFKADSIFDNIEISYKALLEKTKTITKRPSILHGSMIKDTWYVPGGKSYVANLYNQAAGNYIWKDNNNKASQSLSYEVVLSKASKANFWVFSTYAQTKEEFVSMNERYALFDAFKNNKLYSSTKRVNKDGANDYWESGIVKPNVILKDLIKILHPDILIEHKLYYFKHLED